jgi:hypothetical protein
MPLWVTWRQKWLRCLSCSVSVGGLCSLVVMVPCVMMSNWMQCEYVYCKTRLLNCIETLFITIKSFISRNFLYSHCEAQKPTRMNVFVFWFIFVFAFKPEVPVSGPPRYELRFVAKQFKTLTNLDKPSENQKPKSLISVAFRQVSVKIYLFKIFRWGPSSWLGGQNFWLLAMRSRIRFSVLLSEFILEGEDPHSDHGLGSL